MWSSLQGESFDAVLPYFASIPNGAISEPRRAAKRAAQSAQTRARTCIVAVLEVVLQGRNRWSLHPFIGEVGQFLRACPQSACLFICAGPVARVLWSLQPIKNPNDAEMNTKGLLEDHEVNW